MPTLTVKYPVPIIKNPFQTIFIIICKTGGFVIVLRLIPEP